MRPNVLTFLGGNRAEFRLRDSSPAVLLAAVMIVMATLEALGPATLRNDLIGVLGYSGDRPFPGLLTQWAVHASSLIAVAHALYALAAGTKLHSDFGAPITWALFFAGGAVGIGVHVALGIDAAVVGASGAVALWMGAAAAPYSMGPPDVAWGAIGLRGIDLRAPFIAVVAVWFLHHGGGIVMSSASPQGSRLYAGWLAVFGMGVGIGWGLRALRRALQGAGDDAAAEALPVPQADDESDELPMDQVLELMQRRPRQAARILQDHLGSNPSDVRASEALIDALSLLGDKAGIVEEGLARIRLLLRGENAAGAAEIFERVKTGGADAALAKRLSAAQASAVMIALSARKSFEAAHALGDRWLAVHGQDSLAWRVKQALPRTRD